MKKNVLFLLAMFLSGLYSQAHTLSSRDSIPCRLSITCDFEPECLYDDKGSVADEYPDLLVACKHSTVTYTAHSIFNTSATGFLWMVLGDISHSANGNTVSVTWGDQSWGIVSASVTNDSGDTCTLSRQVKLVDVPQIGATTIPAYTVNSHGQKVINVCAGSDIQFIDQSSAGSSDIAGYLWQSDHAPSSSTHSYTIEDVRFDQEVIHQVYSNCGCYDEEVFVINVIRGQELELECYGAVCAGAVVTYHASNPPCQEHWWHVEGGTLLSGQNTPSPTVAWDRPANGYGILSLDGVRCESDACPTLMSVKIPVLHNDLQIQGSSVLCLGESALFSLPLFGSTEYHWTVSPSAGVDLHMLNNSNEARLSFSAPGTYTLQASYHCDFLGCGLYHSQPFTLEVKPALEITGETTLCVANACSLTASPAVAATWKVYDSHGHLLSTEPPSTTLAYTFPAPGSYLVTAEHPDFCEPAAATLSVRDVPPAPSLANMSVADRTVACPFQGIVLHGTPAQPAYSFVWEPVCESASPQSYMGDSVSIGYNGEVCDVNVYHYDRELRCRSTGFIVRTLDELVPLPTSLPSHITVCPGAHIRWTTSQVPDQRADGMLYEWKIQDDKQYCASVQGSHQQPGVVLSVHKFAALPEHFHVILTRTFCGGSLNDTVFVTVRDHISESLTITCPPPLCKGDSATLSAPEGNTSSYLWSVEGNTVRGNTLHHTFNNGGHIPVTLYSNPFSHCSNRDYFNSVTCTVRVVDPPAASHLHYDGASDVLSVSPALTSSGLTFDWQYSPSCNQSSAILAPINVADDHINSPAPGYYRCTVTNASGCSTTLSYCHEPPPHPCTGVDLPFSVSYDVCTRTITAQAPGETNQNLHWRLIEGTGTLTTNGLFGNKAYVSIADAGSYTIQATATNHLCKSGSRTIQVDFLSDFTVLNACDSIKIVNKSKYTDGVNQVHLQVTGPGNYSHGITIPTSRKDHTFVPPTPGASYHVYLTGYGSTMLSTPCLVGTVTTVAPLASVSISTANPYLPNHTCDNTPILLTATANPNRTIVKSEWDFDDGSLFDTTGNSICHTFAVRPREYNVTVTVTDIMGCKIESLPVEIKSYNDPLVGGELTVSGNAACNKVGTKTLTFTHHSSGNHYYWDNQTTPNLSPIYSVHYSRDYPVYVINDHYCQKEASRHVTFLNPPVADIHAESTDGCVNHPFKLYGDNGPDPDITYQWTVTGPNGFNQAFASPNITFNPPFAGTYTATLTVDNGTCSATATKTLSVNPVPAPPTIAFNGSPCIKDAPVQMDASGYSGTMFWSNGNTGPSAYIYYPGPVEAWYFDPALGCPSAKAQTLIDKQPDFDALLTGCYERCNKAIPPQLPVFGLTNPSQTINWQWRQDGNTIGSGGGNYYYSPMLLPLNGTGDYSLSVDYMNANCSESSPTLSIRPLELCPCDSTDIGITRKEMFLDGCRIFWDILVDVCNSSTGSTYCIGQLLPSSESQNVRIVTMNYDPYRQLTPGDCEQVHLVLEHLSYGPATVSFRNEHPPVCHCYIEFSIDLSPDGIPCEESLEGFDFHSLKELSSHAATYFGFSFQLPGVQRVFSLLSSPPMVLNWNYDGESLVEGLCMLNSATVAQLAESDDEICFEAIACIDNALCRYHFCIQAHYLAELLGIPRGAKSASSDKGIAAPASPATQGEPALSPNPATGEVSVTGTTDEVVEVLVMDMNGRQMATFENTFNFNISTLTSGIYIVRVKTKHDNTETITYLKLVKK